MRIILIATKLQCRDSKLIPISKKITGLSAWPNEFGRAKDVAKIPFTDTLSYVIILGSRDNFWYSSSCPRYKL